MQTQDDDQIKRADIFEPLLNSQQAAELMHVHPETVKRRARRGESSRPGIREAVAVSRLRPGGIRAQFNALTRDLQPLKYGNIGVSGLWPTKREEFMFRRARYQQGMIDRVKRKQGPDCWIFRWREMDASGKRVRRKVVLGTIEKYPTESSALKAAESLRVTVNEEQPRFP